MTLLNRLLKERFVNIWFIGIAFTLCYHAGYPQQIFGYDTVRILQYNLMYFNSPAAPCGNTTTTSATRAAHIATLLDHVKPHIFGVNEMNDDDLTATYLLNNAVNTGNRSGYQRANRISNPGDIINNMIFYDPTKVTLLNTTFIGCSPRRISVYTFQHAGTVAGSSLQSVPTKIHVLIAHLKAGSTTEDQTRRGECADNIMAVLNAAFPASESYILMGDLNLYRSTEPAWTKLTDDSKPIFFKDPINRLGNWTGNSAFADIHTQSTRATSSGCFVGGGSDDRFDFILTNENILQNRDYVKYIPGSYKVIGQSGTLFNKAINDASNTSAPTAVLDALFNTSDHFPVTADFRITLSTVPSALFNTSYAELPNPFSGDYAFAGNNITVRGIFNTITGTYRIFGSNTISFSGTNTYTTLDEPLQNGVTFTGVYTLSGARMHISFTQITYGTVDAPGNTTQNSTLPSPIIGNYTLSGSDIRIVNNTNTLVGTVSTSVSLLTFIGTNQYFINSTLQGINAVTIVGLRTFSGSNITLVPQQVWAAPFEPITGISHHSFYADYLRCSNPVTDRLRCTDLPPGAYRVRLLDRFGNHIGSEKTVEVSSTDQELQLDMQHIPSGLYVLRLQHQTGKFLNLKFIKW